MLDHVQKRQEELRKSISGSYSEDTLEKSANEYFEKGRKAAPGEVRQFGGVDYIKTASGWRKVGKNKGKSKDVHDAIHGKKEGEVLDLKEIAKDPKKWQSSDTTKASTLVKVLSQLDELRAKYLKSKGFDDKQIKGFQNYFQIATAKNTESHSPSDRFDAIKSHLNKDGTLNTTYLDKGIKEYNKYRGESGERMTSWRP